MLKKITAFIIAITIILVNTNNVNASLLDIGAIASGLNAAFNIADSNEKKRSDISNWINQNSEWAGFLFDYTYGNNVLTPSYIWSCLPQSVKDQISDSSDETEVLNKTIDMILEGQSVNGNDITNNTNVNTFIKNISNQYVNDNKINIFYACGLQESLNSLNSTIVTDMAEIIEANPDSYFILINTNPSIFFIVFKENGNKIYGVLNHTYDTSWSDFRLYQAVTSNGVVTTRTFTANSSDDMVAYIYNASNQHLEPYTVTYPWNDNAANHGYFNVLPLQDAGGSDWSRYPKSFNTVSQSIETFNSVNELNDYISTYGIGKSPYYYNQEVWQDFSTSSGDYVFSPTNINTVTYGDVSEYIDNSYQDNDYYPDNSQINNWINNTNEENITNNGGGSGGGSGGDDSGGGSGSGTDGIFDFLSDLGEVLGNLIKNLGQAITNIIKGISDLVTSIVTDLPTVFFDFIGAIFGWLPEEWVTLLSLSLAAMLIWGIVKVIRG